MNAKTFRTAAVSMVLGAALATTGIAIGFRVAPLAHAAVDPTPVAAPAYEVRSMPENVRVLRYHRSQPGSVTITAVIKAQESGWSVHSSCKGKIVAQGGQCLIGVRYAGKAKGAHTAALVVSLKDTATGKVSIKIAPVRIVIGSHTDQGDRQHV
jgi:hypothetical protein